MSHASTLRSIADVVPPGCAPHVVGDGDVAVSGITHDSRLVTEGVLFACIRGEHTDGHDHAGEALARGATSLVVDHRLDLPAAGQLVVADVRPCLGWIARSVYGAPSDSLGVIGVTGTNGKTTTAHLLAAILTAAGRHTGVIGTLTGARTTPEATELQARLSEFVERGDDVVVMEVSSHALALHRVEGTQFQVGVFTNLGEDHLDLHGSMESYFRAKARLFEEGRTQIGVVNVDDVYGRLLADSASIDIVPFSQQDASDVVVGAGSMVLTWRGTELSVPLGGGFNVMNVLAAATAAATIGIDRSSIVDGLEGVTPVAGRFQHVDGAGNGIDVIVDYAHTPEGLTSLLSSARELTSGDGRVIVVFGCGGDCDAGKRPNMGAAAAAGSDVTIVTSDNPRHEQPMAIIDAIVAGVDPADRLHLVIEPDRGAAIARAIDAARQGDLVVIAGKGHETTQVVGDVATPFADATVAEAALAKRVPT